MNASNFIEWDERGNAKGRRPGDPKSMFGLLFERTVDAIWLFDPGTATIVDCNEATVALMRCRSRADLVGMRGEDFSPPVQPDGSPTREVAARRIAETLQNGNTRFEWAAQRFDGTQVPLEVTATAIEREGQPLFVLVARDISERKKAEAALLESETRFRSLFEHNADAMLLLDPETLRYVEANDAVARLFRAPNREALENVSPSERWPERQPDGQRSREKAQAMAKLTLAQGSHRFEWWTRRWDGTEVALDIVMTAVPFGKRTLLSVVYRDVSEHKQAENQIRQLNASLEKRVADRTSELVRSNEQLKQAEEGLRQRSARVQKHRDVLLELAQADKSDLTQALQTICSLSAATLEVARVSYWSLQEDGSAIVCEILYRGEADGFDAQSTGVRLNASQYPAYFGALRAKGPIVADRVLTHPATSGLADAYLKPLGISSMLDAPVWLCGEVVGVLCHEHIGPARDWPAEEIDFASALAAMVSVALQEAHRARSERLLRESETKFRALFEATSKAVVLHDETGILEANPSWFRLLGYSRTEEVVGKHPAELSAPIQPGGRRAEVLAARHIAQTLAHGSARFEWLMLRRDGTDLLMEVFLTRIQLGGRQLLQAVCNDITERKRAEAELRESEARLRESEARFSTAFRASPLNITILRLSDARFVEANEAFVRWFGLARDQLLGHDSRELGIWVNLEDREKFLGDLRRQGSLREVECQLRSRRGTVHTLLQSADIIEINREPHILVFGLDITERKHAEAELLRALAREKELGQLRSNFVSMVSHEFRTPLGIIQSSAEILEDYFERLDPAERQEHLQSIRKNTRRMAGLMEEVLLIGSLEAGKTEFKPCRLELSSFICKLVDEVGSATHRRCPIEWSLAGAPDQIQADERLMRHILTNLLTNAVKYSEVGQPVRLEVGCVGPELVCVTCDQGIGIAEADQEWLFSAFHRGQNVAGRPGTGLGLVIVKRCVDLHGGKIEVSSQLGKGTTVTVRMPICYPATGA
ncbi:MAG: PAS domain S-box protein [Verrucomicrobia bacterium]|nr:PAS domain S-box protein [Verrucomicrobiota bacterium]